MADEDINWEKTRIPTVDDLKAVCKRLNDNGVKYILIGGFAMAYHGMPRMTEDIDLLVDPSSDNIERIKKALLFLKDRAVLEIKPYDVEQYSVVRIADEFVIDLLKEACNLRYEESIRTAEKLDMDGVIIPVADIEAMIKTKQGIRPKDKDDLNFLIQLKEKS
jgi:predicted nucleotidyltransferase